MTPFPPVGELPYLLTLPGHGFYWFLLALEAEAPSWHEEALPPPELPVMVLFENWRSFFPEQVEALRRGTADKLRRQLEQEILPEFLAKQRWFSAKGESGAGLRIGKLARWTLGERDWLWLRADLELPGGDSQHYSLPLGVSWGEPDDDPVRHLLPHTLAKVRQQARVGVLHDALFDPAFVTALVRAMGEGREIPLGEGRLLASATGAWASLVGEQVPEDLHRPPSEGSNSALLLGDKLFLKLYRRMRAGLNPEVEMGRYLTEVSPYSNIAPLAGALEYLGPDGETLTLALLQGNVPNQGDCWTYTLDYLERLFEDSLTRSQASPVEPEELYGDYRWLMCKLGQRSGELHQALAKPSGDPAFHPEAVGADDLRDWHGQVGQDLEDSLALLARRREALDDEAGELAEGVLAARATLQARLETLALTAAEALKTRYHGDYHLGQVLLTGNDFILIDFEGEPMRPFAERRRKHSALRDVAGMLRSFSYAGHAALARYTQMRPGDRERLQPVRREWEAMAREAFLEGYREGLGDCRVWPREAECAEKLLALFELEKLLYELRYELDNRPAWSAIPLAGLLSSPPGGTLA